MVKDASSVFLIEFSSPGQCVPILEAASHPLSSLMPSTAPRSVRDWQQESVSKLLQSWSVSAQGCICLWVPGCYHSAWIGCPRTPLRIAQDVSVLCPSHGARASLLVALLECKHCGHGVSLAPDIVLERSLEQTVHSGYCVAVALKEQPPG